MEDSKESLMYFKNENGSFFFFFLLLAMATLVGS